MRLVRLAKPMPGGSAFRRTAARDVKPPIYGPWISHSTSATRVPRPKAAPRFKTSMRTVALHRYGDGACPFGTTWQRAAGDSTLA